MSEGEDKLRWDHPAAAHVGIVNREDARIDWRGRRKFAVVGFASSTRDRAPYDDPEWVICGLNQLYRHIPRADLWFDIHEDFNEPGTVVPGTDFLGWLKACPIPIVMTRQFEDVPNCVRYPIERIIEKFGIDYFTSSISLMIAFAISEGFTHVGVWGVDLIVGQEWDYQKACAEFWLGQAMGRGIEVVLPDKSALLKTLYRYGYEKEPGQGFLKLSMLEGKRGRMAKEREELLKRLYCIDGAIQENDHWRELFLLRMRGGAVGE